MSALIVLIVAVAVTDLVRRETPRASATRRVIALAAGLAAALLIMLLSGATSALDWLLLALSAAALAVWVLLSGQALDTGSRPALALVPLMVTGTVDILLSGTASPVTGAIGSWLAWSHLPGLDTTTPTHALGVAALVLFQLATGNLVVRLVLQSVGAMPPPASTPATAGAPATGPEPTAASRPQDQLRGGRLLGPMERLFLLGFGLAGQVAAAGFVVAAKGLIRWPELQAQSRRPAPDPAATPGTGSRPLGITELTEYFLVGSFASWLLALGSLALTRIM